MRILIDPRCKFIYAASFFFGLQQLFGIKNVGFDLKPFVELNQGPKDMGFDHYMAFVVEPQGKRVVIDYGDKTAFNEPALDWADVYAKINLSVERPTSAHVDRSMHKVCQIGPNFGINQWGNYGALKLFAKNRLKIGVHRNWPITLKQYFGGYNWARKRASIECYAPERSEEGYIFHASQFYVGQVGGEAANQRRAAFIRAAKNHANQFEGGLVTAGKQSDMMGLSDVATSQAFSTKQYLSKTKRSSVVFNTPAAWGCHGWKFAEYFAMGKAIISMPFVNVPPQGIEHGVNIHLVERMADLDEAVCLLLTDTDYRQYLESNAREYFKNHLAPVAMVTQILEKLE